MRIQFRSTNCTTSGNCSEPDSYELYHLVALTVPVCAALSNRKIGSPSSSISTVNSNALFLSNQSTRMGRSNSTGIDALAVMWYGPLMAMPPASSFGLIETLNPGQSSPRNDNTNRQGWRAGRSDRI